MKTKVVFVTRPFASTNGGTEKHLVDLILRLDLSKVDVALLCYGRDAYAQPLKQRDHLPVQIHPGLKANGFFSFWLPFIRLRPEIVVFVHGNPSVYPWTAYLAARMSGPKRIVGIQHLAPLPALGGRFRAWAAAHAKYLLFRRRIAGVLCDETICVSNAVRETLVDHYLYPDDKITTIHNGVDLNHYGRRVERSNGVRETLKISPQDDLLVCVSRLDRVKTVDLLLRALAIVCKEHPSCKCVIVGDGELNNALRSMSMELGLSPSVIFVGHAQDVRPYLAAGDIFVLPSSRIEGLPLVLLEAMASGLPCIAADVGGNKEVVLHERNGLIVRPGSVNELARAITYLLSHKQQRVEMGANGRETVQAHFDIEGTMTKIKAAIFRGSRLPQSNQFSSLSNPF